MRRPNYYVAVASLLALAGCATQYKARSLFNIGGYSESKIAPDTWRVRFDGNEHMIPNQSDEFAKLRAAELCLARRKPFMRLSQFSTDEEFVRGRGGRFTKYPPDASTETDGRTSEALKRMEFVPVQPRFATRSYVTVACVADGSADSIDAARLARSIRAQYELEDAPPPD